MRLPPTLGALVALCWSASAQGQPTPAASANRAQPYVHVFPVATLVPTPVLTLTAEQRDPGDGTSEPAERSANLPARSLIVHTFDGDRLGAELRVRSRGDATLVDLPGAGTWVLRIANRDRPSSRPARLTVVVVGSNGFRAQFRLEPSAIDATGRLGDAFIVAGRFGSAIRSDRVRVLRTRRGYETEPVMLEPGDYILEWDRGGGRDDVRRGHASVMGSGSFVVRFPGSRVMLDMPSAWAAEHVLIELDPREGSTIMSQAAPFEPTLIGDDVVPGPALVRLLRIGANHAPPQELYRETIEVTPESIQTLHWSFAHVVTGVGSARTSWLALPSLVAAPSISPPLDADGVAFGALGGHSIVIGNGRLSIDDRTWTISEPMLHSGSSVRMDGLRGDAFAWVDQAETVSFVNANGPSQETLPFAPARGDPPCHAHDVAVLSESLVVVVGSCGDRGFVFERREHAWHRIAVETRALRAIAHRHGTAVAVGADSSILIRNAQGAWDIRTLPVDGVPEVMDFVDVSIDTNGLAVARTSAGELSILPLTGPVVTTIAPFVEANERRAVSSHCADAATVALYRAVEATRGTTIAPARASRVVLHRDATATILDDGSRHDILGIACDGNDVVIFARGRTRALTAIRRALPASRAPR